MSSRGFFIAAGVALWMPLVASVVGASSLSGVPGLTLSRGLLVLFPVVATLLLGFLIGRLASAAQPGMSEQSSRC